LVCDVDAVGGRRIARLREVHEGYPRLPPCNRTSVRRAGKSPASPIASTWYSAAGRVSPGRRWRPRLRRRTPDGASLRIAVLVVPETTIWPPWAAKHTRAAVLTARPTYPVSVSVGRPP